MAQFLRKCRKQFRRVVPGPGGRPLRRRPARIALAPPPVGGPAGRPRRRIISPVYPTTRGVAITLGYLNELFLGLDCVTERNLTLDHADLISLWMTDT